MSTEEIDETVGELRISQKVEGHFNQGPQSFNTGLFNPELFNPRLFNHELLL